MTDSNPFLTDADRTGQPEPNGQNTQPGYQQPAQPQQPAWQQPEYGQPGYTGYSAPQYGSPAPGSSNPFTAGPTPGAPQYGAPTANVPLDQPWYGCPPVEAVKRFFAKYATFSGHASRSEFWWVFLFDVIVSIVLLMLQEVSGALGFLQFVWSVATIVPMLSISVRRMHDANHSGGWIAIPCVAMIIGGIAAFISAIIGVLQVIGSLPYEYRGADLEDLYYLSQYGYGQSPLASALASMGTAVLLSLLVMLAGAIAYIVLMVLPSKPEGMRFDRVATPMMQGYGMPAPMPGAAGQAAPAYPGAPAAPMYGAAASQPFQPGMPAGYPGSPVAPMPGADPTAQTYQAPQATRPLNAYGEPVPAAPQYETPAAQPVDSSDATASNDSNGADGTQSDDSASGQRPW